MPQGVGYGPQQRQQSQQKPQQQQQSGLPMSPAQNMAVGQMETAQRPFGWLMDMIAHITGQGQGLGAQPPPTAGQPGQPASGGAQSPPGKSSDAGSSIGGRVSPDQVTGLASILQPTALTDFGLMPQNQGSFGWLLQMLQQQQAQAQQGGGIVQLANALVGQPPQSLDLSGSTGQPAQGAATKPAAKKG